MRAAGGLHPEALVCTPTPASAAGRRSVRITLVSANHETWSRVTSTAKVWNSLSQRYIRCFW